MRKCSQKKVFKTFFRRSPIEKNKTGLRKFSARFLVFSNKISTAQKIVLSSSRGQGNFRGLEASRPRTSKCVHEVKDVLKNCTSGDLTTTELKELLVHEQIFKMDSTDQKVDHESGISSTGKTLETKQTNEKPYPLDFSSEVFEELVFRLFR